MFDLQLRRVIRFRRGRDKKFSNFFFGKILAYNVKKRIDLPLGLIKYYTKILL